MTYHTKRIDPPRSRLIFLFTLILLGLLIPLTIPSATTANTESSQPTVAYPASTATNEISNSTQTTRVIYELDTGNDDAGKGPFLHSPYHHCTDVTDNYEIYLGHCDNGTPIISGFRFADVELDNPGAITDIYLELSVEPIYTNMIVPIALQAHIVQNSPDFSQVLPTARVTELTTATVPWHLGDWDDTLPLSPYDVQEELRLVRTPSLLPLIDELRNAHGWQSGQALTFIAQPAEAWPGATPVSPYGIASRRVMGVEHLYNSAYARLVIEYGHTAPPLVSTSYYVSSFEPADIEYMACSLVDNIANNNPNVSSVVVTLFFGQPWMHNNMLVARQWNGTLYTYQDIAKILPAFGQAYLNCATQQDIGAKLLLSAGLNNDGSQVNLESGRAWGKEVRLRSQLWNAFAHLKPEYRQVEIFPAGNLETGFGSPDQTLAWLQGVLEFNAIFYNSVAISGCPLTFDNMPDELAQCYSKDVGYVENGVIHEWSRQDVLDMTNTFPGLKVLPQIYTRDGTNAMQWFLLAIKAGKGVYPPFNAPLFETILTSHKACQQNPVDCGGSADYTNTPEQGWQQIIDLMADDHRAIEMIRLQYASDMEWYGE